MRMANGHPYLNPKVCKKIFSKHFGATIHMCWCAAQCSFLQALMYHKRCLSLILNSSLWLIPAGNSSSATVQEEPPQMRAPPPLMRDHPSWPVVELFMYNLVIGFSKISPNTGRSGEKDDVETCWIPHGRCWGCLFIFLHQINAKYHSISYSPLWKWVTWLHSQSSVGSSGVSLSSKQMVFNVHHSRLVTDILSLWCPAFP